RVVSNDIELDNDERLLYEAIKREIGAADDVSVLAKFAEALNLRLNRSKPELEVLRAEHKSTPLTEREQIEAINARVAEVIRKGLADRGILPFDPGYSEQVKRATYAVNSVAGRKAGECRTVEE